MTNRIFHLALVTGLLITSIVAPAQRRSDLRESQVDKIVAEKVLKKTSDFNLKGKVKSCMTIAEKSKDTILLEFDSDKWLRRHADTKSKELTVYTIEKGQLQTVSCDNFHDKITSFKTFNASGYLDNEVFSWVYQHDPPLRGQTRYTYNASFDTLVIRYFYDYDIRSRDVVLADTYAFVFNQRHQVVMERHLSAHPESTFKATTTYTYDSASGDLVSVWYLADCALEHMNSCSNLRLSMGYDDRHHIVSESQVDATIRNALWCADYHYVAKYNAQNELVAEAFYSDKQLSPGSYAFKWNREFDGQYLPPEYRIKVISDFEYEYDAEGNWIRQYQTENGLRVLVAYRTIAYYY